jgi:hypothetical protein
VYVLSDNEVALYIGHVVANGHSITPRWNQARALP